MPVRAGLDVIELVNDGIELGDPGLGAWIKTLLARPIERLIAKSAAA